MRLLPWLASALALAAPASAPAHLLTRGTPLSELAAASPAAVVGRVESAGATTLTLAAETAPWGGVEPGPLRIALEGHHLPAYVPGSRVLVFLTGSAPPFASRQTALDLVEVPEAETERAALLGAVRALHGLREVPEPAARIARLKALSLAHLESASERVRGEALLDLVAIAGRAGFDAAEVERIAALARRPDARTPGLVVLLATIRSAAAGSALESLAAQATNPQARARALRVVARRGRDAAVPALIAALGDAELAVRLTARRELERLDTPAARRALEADAASAEAAASEAPGSADPIHSTESSESTGRNS